MVETNQSNRYEGGDLVVESLKNLGVGQIFSVSGGAINSIYRAAAAHDLPPIRDDMIARFNRDTGLGAG